MKKLILIILTILNAHAMEPETPPCFFKGMPADIINLIASFLTFNDVETEEEFITRKKTTSLYKPENFLNTNDCTEEINDEKIKKSIAIFKKHREDESKEIDIKNIYFIVYSPDNTICGMTYGDSCGLGTYHLSIINMKTEKELHNIYLRYDDPEKYYLHLAVSSCGNIFATSYTNNKTGDCHRPYTKINNLRTKTKERPNHYLNTTYDEDVLAFNKQGTQLIMQTEKYNEKTNAHIPTHTIIPLTTTLEEREMPQKTLSRYFVQKGICKNFMPQSKNGSII